MMICDDFLQFSIFCDDFLQSMMVPICDQGWCWKGLLGGGALYGPADWNGALSGQEVELSLDL